MSTYNRRIPHLLKSDPQWRSRRKELLSREPLCRSCAEMGRETLAVTVDHIIPRARGGTHDDDNLQPLCKDCHDAKSAKEYRGGLDQRKVINPDGSVYHPGRVTVVLEPRQMGKSVRAKFVNGRK